MFEPHLRHHVSPAQYIFLEMLVRLLQSIRCVKLEVLAESLPLSILFESRRKKLQRFLSLPELTIAQLWFPCVCAWITQTIAPGRTLYVTIDRTSWGPINLLPLQRRSFRPLAGFWE